MGTMRIGLSGIFVDDQDQAKDAQQLYVVPAPGWSCAAWAATSTTGTGRSCSATWPGGWTRRAQAGRL
jgi:hypothetical protein